MVASRCPNSKCDGVCLCVPSSERKAEIKREVAEKKGKK